MKYYESRYCTFAVPDDWIAGPPFAFIGKDATGRRLTAQVLERCFVEALPVTIQLQKQKELLRHLYAGFELVSEGPLQSDGLGEGFTLIFRFLDEEENNSLAQALHLMLGPLFCQLVLASPDGLDRERDRLFAAIAKTFTFHQVDFLAKVQPIQLTSEILYVPQPIAAQGWPGEWRKFPRACVSLPVPSGWEVTEENGDAQFRRNAAEIRLHRDLEGHRDPSQWLADRMKRLQSSGDLLMATGNGRLERGIYASLLYEQRGVGRTWKTAAVTRTLEIFLADRQPVLWSLQAPEAEFQDMRPLLEVLVASCEFLDPAEWETKLAEPWMDYTLRGPWHVEGPGFYVNADKNVITHLRRESGTLPMEALRASVLRSMHQELRLKEGFSERSVIGLWRQHDAFHYGIDGFDLESETGVSIRAAWLMGAGCLYNVFVRGTEPKATEILSVGLLENFCPCE